MQYSRNLLKGFPILNEYLAKNHRRNLTHHERCFIILTFCFECGSLSVSDLKYIVPISRYSQFYDTLRLLNEKNMIEYIVTEHPMFMTLLLKRKQTLTESSILTTVLNEKYKDGKNDLRRERYIRNMLKYKKNMKLIIITDKGKELLRNYIGIFRLYGISNKDLGIVIDNKILEQSYRTLFR